LDSWGCQRQNVKLKHTAKIKKKRESLSLGESLFFLFFTVKEAKLVWLFLFTPLEKFSV
jgi:hypothetical protein